MTFTLDELRMMRVALAQRIERLHQLADECVCESDESRAFNETRVRMRHSYRAEARTNMALLERVKVQWLAQELATYEVTP